MFKKRNDESSELLTPKVSTLTPLPPFRTWVVTFHDYVWLKSEAADPEAEERAEKRTAVYEAHIIDINAAGFIVFSAYFRHPEGDQIMQAPRYFLNPSEWAAIEEVNAMFAEPIKH